MYATQTHAASRVLNVREFAEARQNVPIRPGITLHDVRMALRVERVWHRLYEDGRALLPPPEARFPGWEPDTLVEFGRWLNAFNVERRLEGADPKRKLLSRSASLNGWSRR